MFHLNTEQLIEYWRTQRGAEPMPRRSAIDPTHVLNLLPQLFMLGREGPGLYRFRLAGEFLADLHGCRLRGADFMALWRPDDRISLQMALEAVRRRGEPLVAVSKARTQDGASMGLEIALAPVTGADGEPDRFIGLYQPTSPVLALKDQAVSGLAIRSIETPDSDEAAFPRLRLAAMHGARIA
jgi:hypothetical protein